MDHHYIFEERDVTKALYSLYTSLLIQHGQDFAEHKTES